VLLSDGATNRGLSQSEILAQHERLRGDPAVVVHTVGFAAAGSIDQRFLCDLARAAGGTCAQAETTVDLRRAFVASHHATSGRIVEDRTVPVPAGGDGGDGREVVLVEDLAVPGGVSELRLSLVPDTGRIEVLLSDPRDRIIAAGTSASSGGVVNAAVDGPLPGQWRVLARPGPGGERPGRAGVIVSVREPVGGPPAAATAAGAMAATSGSALAVLVAAAAVPWGPRRRRLPVAVAAALLAAAAVWAVV
jgi:hypothetical protein